MAWDQPSPPVTPRNIAWAAGVYEGEGSCHVSSKSRSITVEVPQIDSWLPHEMQRLFGGSCKRYGPYSGNRNAVWRWTLVGRHARGFLMTIYLFLSPRRKEQVRAALDTWRAGSYRFNFAGRRISRVGSA